MAGPWIELELREQSPAAHDRAEAIVMRLREDGMKLRGDGPKWLTDVETDDLAVAEQSIAGALAAVDEHWQEVLVIGPARG